MKFLTGLCTVLFSVLIFGCAAPRVIMPTMDLPLEPTRPTLKSSVIVQNSVPYIGYTLPEALRLYEYLVRKDTYEEQLRFRIHQTNQLLAK